MALKRSRSTYEADRAPYVALGTPVHTGDSSFLPVWKQDVRDESGRRRLHGAFTGGWSAGYFNTVGSKEGWTPSSFVSSRTSRSRKDSTDKLQQRPEDYMDDEDLADLKASETLQISNEFGQIDADALRHDDGGVLSQLFGETGYAKGEHLLQRMGWRQGQGIGPKTRRHASLEDHSNVPSRSAAGTEKFLFAPKDVELVTLIHIPGRASLEQAHLDKHRYEGRPRQASSYEVRSQANTSRRQRGGGIGVGVLASSDSDSDDDALGLGPRISYNRLAATRKAAKLKRSKKLDGPASTLTNSGQQKKPLLRLNAPLPGFVCASAKDPETVTLYPPPQVPAGWIACRSALPASRTGGDVYKDQSMRVTEVSPTTTSHKHVESILYNTGREEAQNSQITTLMERHRQSVFSRFAPAGSTANPLAPNTTPLQQEPQHEMMRTVHKFSPSPLLRKRFGIKASTQEGQ